tara:strand:+ start:109 stop:702 length:594 start_codon:yes stop_codon:yes gene_type:complete
MDYARVIVGESFRISGEDLIPLQLGHVALLDAIGCDPIESPEDLAVSIFACRTDWRESSNRLFGGSYLTKWKLARLGRRIIRDGFISRMKLWHEYIELNTDTPRVSSDSAAPRTSGTPFLQHVRTTLISKCNYDPQTVMSAQYLQAVWDYLSAWEIEGTCELYTKTQIDDLRKDHSSVKDKIESAHRKKMEELNGRS